MERSDAYDPAQAYWLVSGPAVDTPILLPLPGDEDDLPSMMEFCQRIYPGAPLLCADLPGINSEITIGARPSRTLVVTRLAEVIRKAVLTHDLSLIPIIVVGHAEGADLATCLALAHGYLLGACILFRPTAKAALVRPSALDGLHVLLVLDAAEEAPGTVGWDVSAVLKQAGAEVITERTLNGKGLGLQEAAIARVFATTLFGP